MAKATKEKSKKAVKASSKKHSYQKSLREWRKETIEAITKETTQHPDKEFSKRRYHSINELSSHCWYLAKRSKHIGIVWDISKSVTRAAVSTKEVKHQHNDHALISPAFRERLMLAVTSVNACNACSYAHARAALTEGLGTDEIDALLSGHFENCPKEEQHALLYAQHWAESEGKPDQDARQKMFDVYGKNKTLAIEFTLGSIRIGNYIGNTLEFLETQRANRKLFKSFPEINAKRIP